MTPKEYRIVIYVLITIVLLSIGHIVQLQKQLKASIAIVAPPETPLQRYFRADKEWSEAREKCDQTAEPLWRAYRDAEDALKEQAKKEKSNKSQVPQSWQFTDPPKITYHCGQYEIDNGAQSCNAT